MGKCLRFVGVCLLAAVFFWLGTVFADRYTLDSDWFRLQIQGGMDAEKDEDLQYRVRNAVLCELEQILSEGESGWQSAAGHLGKLEDAANDILRRYGYEGMAHITLTREIYESEEDEFLPAGVYQTLQVSIGSGQGETGCWVILPKSGNASETETVFTGNALRFRTLDLLGKLENLLWGG